MELGPGLIENIYDGIQRPLEEIMQKAGANITRGVEVPALDQEKKWDFTRRGQGGRPGQRRRRARHGPGDQRGAPQDHGAPHDERHASSRGIQAGAFNVTETVAVLQD